MTKRRPLTPAEREQRRRWMQAAWAEGKFANRRPRRKIARHWTPAQNQALADLAGTRPISEIVDELERRFYIRRTVPSVRIQAKRLGLSLWSQGLTMREVSALFGIDHRVIRRHWVDAGYLAGRRWQARGPYDGWWFAESEVSRLIREHGWLVDVARMTRGHRLTRLAETAQKADPWIVGRAAICARLGVSEFSFALWMTRGLVPYRRRPGFGGGGVICVRGRDILAIREAIGAARRTARQAAGRALSERNRLALGRTG